MSRDETPASMPRRAILAAAASALAGVALAPGIRLLEVAQGQESRAPGASPKVRWGLLIDTTRCPAGCEECIAACRRENGIASGTRPTDPQWIRKVHIRDASTGRTTAAPVMCQHCASAPCVDVCPTQASFKRADGIVLVDRHRCIGCRYCMMACPYKARSFVHAPIADQRAEVPRGKGCVEGCTLCVHRIDKGARPACVESCPAQAIVFGDLDDPASDIARRVRATVTVQVRADLQLDPGVRYVGI